MQTPEQFVHINLQRAKESLEASLRIIEDIQADLKESSKLPVSMHYRNAATQASQAANDLNLLQGFTLHASRI